jgi:hypothetical protein
MHWWCRCAHLLCSLNHLFPWWYLQFSTKFVSCFLNRCLLCFVSLYICNLLLRTSSCNCTFSVRGTSGNLCPCNNLSVTLWLQLAHQVSQFWCDGGQQEVTKWYWPDKPWALYLWRVRNILFNDVNCSDCTALVVSELGIRAGECRFVCNKSHIGWLAWDWTQDVAVIVNLGDFEITVSTLYIWWNFWCELFYCTWVDPKFSGLVPPSAQQLC